MKKTILFMALAAMCASCQKTVIDDSENSDYSEVSEKVKKFTFTLKGDFSNEWKPVTRGYLQADGKDLTDVWVLDYMDGNLVQQLHQNDNTADDFGKPVMNLKYGQHHVYFIVSRGASPIVNTDNHTIIFGTVRDTFWKDYEVTVVATSNGNRAVTLDRVVTKLRLVFTDAIPSNAASFNVTPVTWYYGIDYTNGEPIDAASNQTITVNIPSSSIGVTDESVNIFGFSSATEWNTDVTFNSKTSGGNIISNATITGVPFKRNRVTEYSGPLFGSDGDITLSLNTTWDTALTGTW